MALSAAVTAKQQLTSCVTSATAWSNGDGQTYQNQMAAAQALAYAQLTQLLGKAAADLVVANAARVLALTSLYTQTPLQGES